jgi:transposase, IS5 family
MGRHYLKSCDGDRCDAVLAAAGYNFGLLLRWLGRFLRTLIAMLVNSERRSANSLNSAFVQNLH